MKYKLLLLLSFLTLGCYKNGPSDCEKCKECKECKEVIVADEDIRSNPKEFDIHSYKIDSNCLQVVLSYGGCEKADVTLTAAKDITKSFPPQREVWFTVSEVGLCEVSFTEEHKFCIEDLQTTGNNIILNIQQIDMRLTYEY